MGRTFAGPYRNPADDWIVVPNPDEEAGGYRVAVKVSADEILEDVLAGRITREEAEELRERGWRLHNSSGVFEDDDEAHEWIESVEESFERDYDDYLEENRHEICRMEAYEAWKNEY